MSKQAAHSNRWEIAETIFGTALLLGIILNFLVALPLSKLLPRAALLSIGVVLMLGGVWMITVARAEFRRAGQPTDPGDPTTRLITSGPFAWSRNPLYLGGMIFFLGLGAALNSGWLYLLAIPTTLALHYILIVPEEHYLAARFGDQYHQYRKSVYRWLGRKSR